MGNCPFSPLNKSRNGNRDWVRGYSIGHVIDNISDGMLLPTMHNIWLMGQCTRDCPEWCKKGAETHMGTLGEKPCVKSSKQFATKIGAQNAAQSTQGVVLNWLLSHVSHLPYTAQV